MLLIPKPAEFTASTGSASPAGPGRRAGRHDGRSEAQAGLGKQHDFNQWAGRTARADVPAQEFVG